MGLLADPGRRAVAGGLLWDHQTTLPLFAAWRAWLAERRPPTLAVWGEGDPSFVPAGVEAWRAAGPSTAVLLVDTGHSALVQELDAVAALVDRLLCAATA